MSSSEPHNRSARASAARHGGARNISHAVAERARGRRRLNATTATASFASVLAAGAVAAALPGATHNTSHDAANTGTGSSTSGSGSVSSGSGSSSSSNSNSSSSDSNSSGSSANLQTPSSAPVQSSGGGQATSGSTW